MERPHYLGEAFSSAFRDRDVARAYRHRPPYPAALFDRLLGLMAPGPRAVLDVGCGRGEVARPLAPRVARVDALDVSAEMVAEGRRAPGGDAPNLRWTVGRAEDAPLDPPYALVVGAQSLHWVEWWIVLPRLRDALLPGGYLAVVDAKSPPVPWADALDAIVRRYSTNPEYIPFDMLAAWSAAGLWKEVDRWSSPPAPFAQPVDDYLDSLHSLSGLSRSRLGPERTAALDADVRALVTPHADPDGRLSIPVAGRVVWGRLLRPDREQAG
ncbi:MAG TPA: methyltransferase domain-containing protein [Thermomicrobiaceae bacterium]|nr:methyltransferase domain-containing protein [Thermomicrobiaceae bacterium]